jgi:hypothetical protein
MLDTPRTAQAGKVESACVTLVALRRAGQPRGGKDLDFAVELLLLPNQN